MAGDDVDYEKLKDLEAARVPEWPSADKRRLLDFLTPEEKMTERLIAILQWLSLSK